MSRKLSKDEFLIRAKSIHGDKYDYSKIEYINANVKVCIICPIHGEFWQKPSKHLLGQGCPKCADLYRGEERSLKKSDFLKKAREIHGDKYVYSKVDWKNGNEKVTIVCPIHGDFEQKPLKHLLGQGCPKCANNLRMTTEEFVSKAKLVHGCKYIYDKTVYVTRTKKVIITCPIHGDFEQTPSDHLRGRGCRLCGNEHKSVVLTMSQDEAIGRILEGTNYRYEISKDFKYVNDGTKVKMICPIHGEFETTPHSLFKGHGCPSCGRAISKKEIALFDFVSSVAMEKNVERNKKKLFKKVRQEVDIYVPSKKIAFEFDGILWHSEKFNKDKNYHLNKLKECNELGIRLVHIFEDEWDYKQEIVKSKIKHLLGKDDGEVIYARKCSIREISFAEAKEFLEKNHIQGYVSSTIYLGGFYNGILVGVMSLVKEKENKWNLTRFAYDINTRCVGLYGKMFHHFIKNYDPSEVKSFADRRWTISSEDNAYTKIGFKLDRILPPDYRYIVNNKREHKFGFRKDRLEKKYGISSDNKTEQEMTEELGFYRIWDCGLFKYVWKKEET